MSPARFVSIFLILLSAFVLAPPSSAQITNVTDTASTPIEGAGHDYIHLLSETVNPANGSVSLRIQVPLPKGRGISIPFSIGYDSNSVRHLEGSGYPEYGTAIWKDNTDVFGQGGWVFSVPAVRSDGWTVQVAVVTGVNDGNPVYTLYPCYYESNYVFREASGDLHSLGLGSLLWGPNPPPSGCPLGAPSSSGRSSAFAASAPFSTTTLWAAFPPNSNIFRPGALVTSSCPIPTTLWAT